MHHNDRPVELFCKAYFMWQTDVMAENGFQATRLYPCNHQIFSDIDLSLSRLMLKIHSLQESKGNKIKTVTLTGVAAHIKNNSKLRHESNQTSSDMTTNSMQSNNLSNSFLIQTTNFFFTILDSTHDNVVTLVTFKSCANDLWEA